MGLQVAMQRLARADTLEIKSDTDDSDEEEEPKKLKPVSAFCVSGQDS